MVSDRLSPFHRNGPSHPGTQVPGLPQPFRIADQFLVSSDKTIREKITDHGSKRKPHPKPYWPLVPSSLSSTDWRNKMNKPTTPTRKSEFNAPSFTCVSRFLNFVISVSAMVTAAMARIAVSGIGIVLVDFRCSNSKRPLGLLPRPLTCTDQIGTTRLTSRAQYYDHQK